MTFSALARLQRSTLFVPGSSRRMIEKAAASEADAVCLDLEDAVALAEKGAARTTIIRALQELDFGRRIRIVRVNGLDTPFTYRDLVDVIEAAGAHIDLVMLPKAERPEDISFVARLLEQIEASAGFTHRIGIEAQIETAAGFLYAREIAAASPRLETLIFGPGDFAASMRMPLANIGERDAHDDAYSGHRWHAVMQVIVAAARANGLRCMDGPYAGLEDSAGLAQAADTARALGFDGKQCIHPKQLACVNHTFSPSAEARQRAERIVAAYAQAQRDGYGAIAIDGKMIDAANLRMAQVVVAHARLLDSLQAEH